MINEFQDLIGMPLWCAFISANKHLVTKRWEVHYGDCVIDDYLSYFYCTDVSNFDDRKIIKIIEYKNCIKLYL